MIYLFHGSDLGKVRAKAFQWVAATRKKQPEAPYLRFDAASLSEAALFNALGTQGLFFKKSLILIDDPFSLADTGALVLEHLDLLKNTDNIVAVLAPKLLAVRAKKLEAKAEKVFVCDSAAKSVRGFNSALVNALAAKDGATLWKELVKAGRAGDAPEALHGLLHWKARDMMQKGNQKWGVEGSRVLSRQLITLLSEARSGDSALGPALERFALTLTSR